MVGFGQKTYVPDDIFETYLEASGMGDGIALNDSVLTGNINTVSNLNISSLSISNLTGIEDFIALTYFDCGNNNLSSLDISNNTALTHFTCNDNQLASLDLTNHTALINLNCWTNQLTYACFLN